MFNPALAAQREYSSTETAIGVTIFVVLIAALYLTPTLISLVCRVPGAVRRVSECGLKVSDLYGVPSCAIV